MERVQIVALAVLVAVLALFGASHVLDRPAPPAGGEVVGGALGDQPAPGARLWSRERETRRGGRPAAPAGDAPARERAPGGAEADAADGSAAEIIAGLRRRAGSTAGADGGPLGAAPPGAVLTDDLLAARAGSLPRAGGGSDPGQQREFEPAEEEPARDDDAGGVLLSIPLKGSLDPEQGGDPTRAEGVVVDGEAVDFTEEAQYTLPAGGHVNGDSGTIAFDIEPHWTGTDQSNNSLLQIRNEHQWENNLQIVKNYNSLRFIIIDEAGVETNVNVYIDDWQPAERHRVTATWGEALMTLYVDGQQVGQTTVPNGLVFGAATPIHVGSDFPGSVYRGANGRISNLTIHDRALGAGELN